MRILPAAALCLFCLFSSCPQAADGGISLGTTRVIFPSDKNSVGLTVNNSSKQDSWLLRSWITPYQNADQPQQKNKAASTSDASTTADASTTSDASSDKKMMPFIITPPLYRIDPEGQIQLRINATAVAALPADRESVFYINVMAIPPKTTINSAESSDKESLSGGYIQFAINNRIKLFYRPLPLNDGAKLDAARKKLRFTRQGNHIEIHNPTPYYFTLTNILVNGKALDAGKNPDTMVAPFGDLSLSATDPHTVTYQTINDFGGNSQSATVTF